MVNVFLHSHGKNMTYTVYLTHTYASSIITPPCHGEAQDIEGGGGIRNPTSFSGL
jgi:hypothetical protein